MESLPFSYTHLGRNHSFYSRNPSRFRLLVGFSVSQWSNGGKSFRICSHRSIYCKLSDIEVKRRKSIDESVFDVVIVGAGIIGLTVARQFLCSSNLSVAVVDSCMPCAGATGAGQGYIWMAHRTPESDSWELQVRSKHLWEDLAKSIQDQGMDPADVLGWRKTGSLLIGTTQEESNMLRERVELLSKSGLRAEYLSATALSLKEPSLSVGKYWGAAFLSDDCQMDAHNAVAFIEKINRCSSLRGRYAEFYHDPVISILRSNDTGIVEAVQTSKNLLFGRKAIIVAAGAWSGSLMHTLLKEVDIRLDVPVKPRKGHLLVIENFKQIHLNHGIMEAGYIDHQMATQFPISQELLYENQKLSISMTATYDNKGNLLLGSSRQFCGFNSELDHSVISLIWERAMMFLPELQRFPMIELIKRNKIRVGLRPYMPDGNPIIGPVPSLPNLFLATGHEGGGLCMALGTAEMIVDMVLGNSEKVDSSPFSLEARSCR